LSLFFSNMIGCLGKLFLASKSLSYFDYSNFEIVGGYIILRDEEWTESTEFFFIEIFKGRRGFRYSTFG
jgi:hypothetical protein